MELYCDIADEFLRTPASWSLIIWCRLSPVDSTRHICIFSSLTFPSAVHEKVLSILFSIG